MNDKLLIKNALVLYDNKKIFNDYAVYIEKSEIIEINKSEELEKKYTECKIIDAENQLVMPGLINAHTHFYSTFSRGIPFNLPPSKSFVDILKNLWWRLDKKLMKEDIYYSSMVSLISAIKKGTTTIIDHHSSPRAVSGSLDTIYKAFHEAGLRGATCYEVSDRDGKEICLKALKENMDFINKYNKNKDSLVKGLFGLHAAFTLNNETLSTLQNYNDSGYGYHIHVSEAVDDSNTNLEKYNKTAVQRLHAFGITGENSIFAHCNHLIEEDIEIIKETKTNVVHNPQSNMNNAVGTADIVKYLSKDITVGLGTDGMCMGMFDAINLSFLIHKHNKKNANIGFEESYKLIMQNNPEIASKIMGYNVGKIKEGYKSDIIILDYNPATPLNSDNFWSHMIFGIIPSGRVKTTIVNGKILMENYEINNIDEKEIYHKSRELADNLWNRF